MRRTAAAVLFAREGFGFVDNSNWRDPRVPALNATPPSTARRNPNLTPLLFREFRFGLSRAAFFDGFFLKRLTLKTVWFNSAEEFGGGGGFAFVRFPDGGEKALRRATATSF
jgi:hypothetical protein